MTTQTLYRFFDADDRLLYVGITINPGSRWRGHARTKPWWVDVARIELEQHPDRASVETAERRAIIDEKPLHNVTHNGTRTKAPAPATRAHRNATPTAAPRTADRYERTPMLAPGRVLAVALTGGTCPVGVVIESDFTSATLELYSWLTGRFDAGRRTFHYKQIHCLRDAEPLDAATKTLLGHHADDLIWDMQPLADFQDDWLPVRQSDAAVPDIAPAVPDLGPKVPDISARNIGHYRALSPTLTCDGASNRDEQCPIVTDIPGVMTHIAHTRMGTQSGKCALSGTASTAPDPS